MGEVHGKHTERDNMKAGERSLWDNCCVCQYPFADFTCESDWYNCVCHPSHYAVSVIVSNHSVPCGLDSDRSLLPLTPPLLLLVSPPLARFRQACTLGGSLWSLAGLLPKAEGHREANREGIRIKWQWQHLLLINEGVVSDYEEKTWWSANSFQVISLKSFVLQMTGPKCQHTTTAYCIHWP